ncbi:MAG: hypothetical protein IPM92_10030 [Saprospiraceae bacterium]|nr:hypothetical protein [Saprospiraceae bacterium]
MHPRCISFTILCCLCFSISCQNSSSDHSGQQSDKNSKPSGKTKSGSYLKLRKHEVIDREGSQMVAMTGLIPEDWKVRDQLYWEYNDATLPIRYKGQYTSGNGDLVIEIYPDVRAVYSTGPMGSSGYPPPRDAVSGLRDFVQQQRGQYGFKILEAKSLMRSGPTQNYIQGTAFQTAGETALLRIAYTENQQAVEEEFYGQLEITHSISQGAVTLTSVIWSASGMYSCKAPAGKLEACRKIALTLKSSARMTLPFYNKFTQVVQLLSDQVYQRIYAAGQISRIISQTNDQISKSISDSYWQTQRSYDRSNQQFSNHIRGVDTYQDGTIQIQLPAGYSNAWINDRGEYLLGETNAFDPNQMWIGNWKQLERGN